MSDRVFVLGARPRNIGAAVANELFLRGWKVRSDDCAVGDGSRPPGGNLPDAETARRHGYNETEKGHYQRYDAPAVRTFREFDADALVVSLGATYKSHFIDATEWDLENVQGTPMWAQVERDVMESKGMTYEEADAYNRKDLKMPDLLTADEVASVVATLLQVPAMDWLSGTAVELNGGSR
jgi:hypothetical protein